MKLSNLARVILSKAKNPVLAASLVALVACTDYLEDFQDKYDNGNAFAEISSDGGNGDDDGKSSSSNGGDSELSSSSKGNGDAESSDSKNSSSSVGNGTFSSGSISYERCSGTVIYDASKDSLNGIFGYPFMTNYASGMQASSKGIKAKLRDQTEFLTLALADLSKDKTRDIETWGGLCIEYSSDGQADFVLLNDSLGKVRRFLSNKLPVTNGDKASFKWLWSENEKLQEKQAELGYSNEPLSINKVSRLHFDNYYLSKTTTITIFRITTINEVDLDVGSSSSVTESSSSAFESCTGTVIYDAEEDLELNIFGRKFITYVPGYGPESSKTSPDGVTAYLSQEDILIMPLVESPNTMNIEPWGGFCVEYTGSGVLHANVVDGSSDNKPILLYKEMPNTNGEKSSFTWSWNENIGLMEKQEDNGSSEGFSIEKVESINFNSYSGNSSITIHKITTLKPDVHFECDGEEFPLKHIEYFSPLGFKEYRIDLESVKEYKITLLGNYTVLVNDPSDQAKLAKADGFCIEYSSDKNFLLSFHSYETNGTLTNDSANVSIYKGEKKISYILWKNLEEEFNGFNPINKHVLAFSAKQTENDTTNILISRMTLIE